MDEADFAVQLLRTSARGFAALAANRMVELDAEAAGRVGGVAEWQQHLEWLLLELAVAVEDQDPELFEERVSWTRRGFEARGLDAACLGGALAALGAVFDEQLPEGPRGVLRPFLQAAEGIVGASEAGVAGRAAPAPDELVERYLDAAIRGESAGAIELVRAAVRAGELSHEELFVRFVPAAMREVGVRWHEDRASVLEEHVATRTTQRLIDVVSQEATRAPTNGRSALLGMVAGDAHDMGCRALAALLELDGWRVMQAGADVPPEDFTAAARKVAPDLVVVGGTLPTHRPAMRSLAPLLASACPSARVYLSGGAVRRWDAAAELGIAGCVSELSELLTTVRAAFPG